MSTSTTSAGALTYTLTMRQEPLHARFCTSATDRRPIDPPPIIEMRITGPNRNETQLLQNPNYFAFVTLVNTRLRTQDTEQGIEYDEVHPQENTDSSTPARLIVGSAVSSLHVLKDPECGGRRGGFFIFPEIGVRAEGKYRLKFSVYEVDGTTTVYRDHIYSNVFEVFQSRKFPGMQKSTLLSCSFSEQGVKIWIRKNVRERRNGVEPLLESSKPAKRKKVAPPSTRRVEKKKNNTSSSDPDGSRVAGQAGRSSRRQCPSSTSSAAPSEGSTSGHRSSGLGSPGWRHDRPARQFEDESHLRSALDYYSRDLYPASPSNFLHNAHPRESGPSDAGMHSSPPPLLPPPPQSITHGAQSYASSRISIHNLLNSSG
ncbi:hypothetical protein CYLTODRAFT_387229 [Cylindrobasidium torrendii FP15055 ss-10]|uniref:Velvet domain-containing protein n=1 Tax=Cylindrobasidium torrendii FP15055 ss-10 TaxID=1314674 RepID=A0A0D7BST2_9AGAR|nr:hypothetical protein CYLTODRAFT_387229 [Cylindrobasidium torrendii FP15055 ss-10]